MRSHPSVGFVAAGPHRDRRTRPSCASVSWGVAGVRAGSVARAPDSHQGRFAHLGHHVIRRSAAEELSPLFDPRYWWYADQFLWLRLASRWDFGYVAKPLLFMSSRGEPYLNERVWESALGHGSHPQGLPEAAASDLGPPPGGTGSLRGRQAAPVAGIRAGRMLRRQPWTQGPGGCLRLSGSGTVCARRDAPAAAAAPDGLPEASVNGDDASC